MGTSATKSSHEVSERAWSDVDKTKLPRSAFLVHDSENRSDWKLPVYEGAGGLDDDGRYTERGPLNLNGLRAARSAAAGGRTGKAMELPAEAHAELERLAKKHLEADEPAKVAAKTAPTPRWDWRLGGRYTWKQVIAASAPLALYLDTGPARTLGGRVFEKEVARVGEWKHPSTGQLITFSRDDLDEIAKGTNAYIAASGGRLRFPNKHDGVWITGEQPNAEDNLGAWLSFRVDGDRLVGVCEAGDDDVAKLLGGRIRGVSLCLVPEAKDAHGNTYARVLDHVAATPEPVIADLDNFHALSRSGRTSLAVLRLAVSTKKETKAMGGHLHSIAKALAMEVGEDDKDDDEKLHDMILSKIAAMKGAPREADANAMSVHAAQAAALAAKVGTLEKDLVAEKAKVTALAKDLEAREQAECEREVGEVVALAASNGRPEAFDADAQKYVRERWAKDREAAKRELSRAKALAGAAGKIVGKIGAPVKPAAAPRDGAVPLSVQKETFKKNAIAAGMKLREEGERLYAFRPGDKRDVVFAALPEG